MKKPKGKPRGSWAHLDPWRWKKGQSGNPGGKNLRRALITREIQDHLEDVVPGLDMTVAQVVARNIIAGAMNPKDPKFLACAEMVLDRIEGKAQQTVKVEGEITLSVEERAELVKRAQRILENAGSRSED